MKSYLFSAISGNAKNHPFGAALLCSKDHYNTPLKTLNELPQFIALPETKDPVKLDIMLCKAIKKVCPPDIKACAITICAWENGPVSGSVIGNPHSSSSSAEGELEKLDDDLWCAAYSGGPGFVVSGTRLCALKAQQIITDAKCLGENPWEKFKSFIDKENVPACIYVADGSGSKGFIFAKGENGSFIKEL